MAGPVWTSRQAFGVLVMQAKARRLVELTDGNVGRLVGVQRGAPKVKVLINGRHETRLVAELRRFIDDEEAGGGDRAGG
jgi:hypothetical protein